MMPRLPDTPAAVLQACTTAGWQDNLTDTTLTATAALDATLEVATALGHRHGLDLVIEEHIEAPGADLGIQVGICVHLEAGRAAVLSEYLEDGMVGETPATQVARLFRRLNILLAAIAGTRGLSLDAPAHMP